MPDNKNDSHPFEEDILKNALSESLQFSSRADTRQTHSDEPEEAIHEGNEMASEVEMDRQEFDSLLSDERLSYDDLEEAWQENDADDTAEDEGFSEDAREEEVYQVNRGAPNVAPPSEPEHQGKGNNPNGSGISRIVVAVIVLCAIGFTASNWMANRKIDVLTAKFEGIEARISDNSGEGRQQAQQEAGAGQENEAILMQLSAQIMENREAIETMKQELARTDAARPADMPAAKIASPEKQETTQKTPAAELSAASGAAAVQATPAVEKAVAKNNEPPKQKTAETEAGRNGQGWNVVLMSLKNEDMANKELARLKGKGIQAEKHTVKVKGVTYHQLRAGWFERKDEALLYIKNTITELGYRDAWIRHSR